MDLLELPGDFQWIGSIRERNIHRLLYLKSSSISNKTRFLLNYESRIIYLIFEKKKDNKK